MPCNGMEKAPWCICLKYTLVYQSILYRTTQYGTPTVHYRDILSNILFIHLFTHLSIYPSIYLSICLFGFSVPLESVTIKDELTRLAKTIR